MGGHNNEKLFSAGGDTYAPNEMPKLHAGNAYTKRPPAVQMNLPLEDSVSPDAVEYRAGRRVTGVVPELAAPIDLYASGFDKMFGPISAEMVADLDVPVLRPGPITEVPAGTTPKLTTREVCEAMEAARAPNPKTLMGRKRLPVSSVLPWPALMRIAEAMQYGAFEAPRADGGKGYGPYNWRDQDVEAMTYIDANDRHKARWVEGQEIDPKSLAMELAHAAASLIILIDAIDNGTWIDNRPRVRNQAASRILDDYEGRSK
jgi:dATP/dGTP diphosphohydrolase